MSVVKPAALLKRSCPGGSPLKGQTKTLTGEGRSGQPKREVGTAKKPSTDGTPRHVT
jgi:hypothetical protein